MLGFRWILPEALCWFWWDAQAQCNALRPQVTIDFNTDQDCAPVTVTQFEIIYYFNVAQNPNSIQIRYVWNDPANTETTIGIGNGLVASLGNTAFTANASFTYFDNNGECSIRPTSYVLINGVVCPTSEQRQSAFFWGTDVQANAQVELAPNSWDVCFNNPVTNATFADVSEFNCNINVEPDNPNRFARHVQIVYGTNHNPAATIRNLSLTDGGPQPLTNAAGALAMPQTRGTAGLPVTGAYFGPLQTIPFPADGPVSVSFPMNAPANPLNVVGNLAIPPLVDFTYDPAQGCLPLKVTFTNRTQFADPNRYQWQFGDGKTSTQINPVHTYFEPGTYTVSLTASNSTGQSAAEVKQRIIVVNPLPEARFDVRPKVVEVPDGILYTSNRSFNATRYEWDFGDGEKSFLPEPLHRYKQEGVYDITLIAFNQFNCSDTARMPGAVSAKKGGELLVPNAFSPNVAGSFSDGSPGKNDVFLPLIRGVRDFEMLIFNRWGELLFVSRDTQTGWDGFYKGRPCVQDVYVYRITATFEDGEKIVRVGDVNLIR
jgi:gliding motility-associated-like protein